MAPAKKGHPNTAAATLQSKFRHGNELAREKQPPSGALAPLGPDHWLTPKQLRNWFSQPITRHVKRPLLDFVGQFGRDSQGVINRSMQVLDYHALFERLARTFIGSDSVQISFLNPAAKKEHATRIGEVPVHAVILEIFDLIWNGNLIFYFVIRFTFHQRV